MTRIEIQELLEKPYNQNDWKDFLQSHFTNNKLYGEVQTIQLAQNPISKHCVTLGNYEVDDFTKIGIFEIQINDKVNITRNRVALRNILKDITAQVAGAMVVFVQGDKWRFSYISKRKVKNKNTNLIEDKETAPKRFTYLFGKGEKARTASDRFEKLINKQQQNIFQLLSLNDFEEAFSVEKLSIDFFNEYKKVYDDFVEFITGKRYVKKGNKFIETKTHEAHFQLRNYFDGEEKLARDFFKRMMGRIVFLYFIQKKGWLSVAKGKNWGEGNPDYLFELYKNAKYKDSFYSDYLVPLFFDTLNNSEVQKESNAFRFPYLNGGLFDKEQDYRYNKIALPSEIFEKLFNTFNNFNFTIYEDAPDEQTVAVDPEMLGHIFENLLEDNKDKGAFYTPKDIVHYMCRESLHNYIYTYTQNEQNDDFKQKLKQYNDNYDLTIFSNSEIKQIDRALEDVKICDPAIGSGAFPMGLLHEIYHLKIPIEDAKGLKAKSPADLKKHIIEESIYGVDIDNGAVDIARLRFWLSLVVDETEPQPLPNLAFKIVCANTLIPLGMDNNINIAGATEVVAAIEKVREDYFDASKEDKKDLERKFKNLQNKLWATAKDWVTSKERDIYQKLLEFNPFEDKSCTWFDAWWMFGVKDGFDIVIGNPPYVDIKALQPSFVKDLFKLYKTAVNRINLYSIFIERGHELLNKKGTLAFIIPNSLLLNDSYYKTRQLILKDVRKLIKLPDAIFENAIVETIILILNKGNKSDFIDSIYFKNNEVSNLTNLIFDVKSKKEWSKDEMFKFNIFKDDEKTNLLNLILRDNILLKDEVDFSLGITPYDKAKGQTEEQIINKVFHSNEKLSSEYVPLIIGKNIQKYNIDFHCDEYLKYGNWLGAPRDIKFFKNPKIVVRQILSGKNLSIISSFTDVEIYFTQIGFSLISKVKSNKNLKYILALLNSNTINFYHKYKFLDLEKKTFPKILIANCKQFPIANINLIQQKSFITLVDYLLYLYNKENPQIFDHTDNTRIASNIEEVLNMMVYELYFEEHMKQNDIDVLQFIQPKPIDNLDNDNDKVEVIKNFYLWLQTADNIVRQRINSIDIKSPDILSVINSATK